MSAITFIIIMLSTALAMEFVAFLAHKYLMQSFLWSWHHDHHNPNEVEGFFEKNDLFFLIFAIPSFFCYFFGSLYNPALFAIGIGISIYGMIYFLIHDVYIHQRFRWFRQLDSKYSRAILRAHGAHHAKIEKEAGESFGLLIVHPKFFGKRKDWQKKES
jgi:beta-carotene 3-hydroxylase